MSVEVRGDEGESYNGESFLERNQGEGEEGEEEVVVFAIFRVYHIQLALPDLLLVDFRALSKLRIVNSVLSYFWVLLWAYLQLSGTEEYLETELSFYFTSDKF